MKQHIKNYTHKPYGNLLSLVDFIVANIQTMVLCFIKSSVVVSRYHESTLF
jgi:hypothetical protein